MDDKLQEGELDVRSREEMADSAQAVAHLAAEFFIAASDHRESLADAARREMNSPHIGDKHRMLKYFRYEHLPPRLQLVSMPFCELAEQMLLATPAGEEQSAGLRKLLESKDRFVRAALD